MFRASLFAAAAAISLAGCAGGAGTQAETSSSATAAPAAAATPAPTPQPAAPAAPAAPATYTDAQLRSFAAASHDIQPLNAQLTSGTPEQRAAATAQVRSILQRNNLDGATYNAIAAQAHSDPAIAARIAALAPPAHG